MALTSQRNGRRKPTYTGTYNGDIQGLMVVVDQRV